MTRRRFIQGLAAGTAITGLNLSRWPALALGSVPAPPVLIGDRFDLVIESLPVNFTGHAAFATAVNGLVPGPLLRWREGDTVTLSVTNRLDVDSSIHWHGVRAPAEMDGVPGLSFRGIAPGETFVYRIPVRQSGTYWYHSHSRFQEQTGHYGPLIIDPRNSDSIKYDRDYVVMLSDWTDRDPETIYGNLKQQSDYYNYHQLTARSLVSEASRKGLGATIANRLKWAGMTMSPTDLSDVSGATYTYLVNGHPPAANWTALFHPNERMRLRFINGSSMTFFDVRIPGLPMTLIQADGNDLDPFTVDEFRIAVAETYDVIVEPRDESAYTIFAQSADRSGYARGTLAPRYGMTAEVPPMDPRPRLTMVDMGMGGMAGTNMAGVDGMNQSDTSGMNPTTDTSMPGMNRSGMNLPAGRSNHTKALSQDAITGKEPFPQPGPDVPCKFLPAMPPVSALKPSNPIVLRPGPEVDNVAPAPISRLSDPGNGLRGNGRRVLAYSDLRARYRGADPRPPAREIELHLSGNMERYIWGFNGEKFSEAEPIRLGLGERLRIVLINDTMMAHPIHLHGLWSELENGQGEFRPYKHTISVMPGERLSYLISADTPGRWAYHCHLLYHMEAGMFRTVIVS